MKKIFLTLLSAGLLLVACKKTETTENNANTTETSIESESNLSSETTFEGTFVGELPCADCESISETLTLKKDGTYVKESVYKGGENENINPIKVEGKYTVEGNKISLEGIQSGASNLYESEGEDKLHYLSSDGKKVEGELSDKYILTKK